MHASIFVNIFILNNYVHGLMNTHNPSWLPGWINKKTVKGPKMCPFQVSWQQPPKCWPKPKKKKKKPPNDWTMQFDSLSVANNESTSTSRTNEPSNLWIVCQKRYSNLALKQASNFLNTIRPSRYFITKKIRNQSLESSVLMSYTGKWIPNEEKYNPPNFVHKKCTK